MAERRMFSKSIVDSDFFLDMPISAQNYYFHLGIRADDDGFVGNPKKIARMINAGDDDKRILLAKKFIIDFASGIIVVRHWRIHNCIQKDRYKPTLFQEEKTLLSLDKSNVYILDTESTQDVYTGKGSEELGQESQDPSLSLSPKAFETESFDFKTFREQLLKICPNFSFSLQNKLGYSAEHTGFCLKNGYIYDVHNQRLLDKSESFEIWNYLFSVNDKVFELAMAQ